MIPWAEMLVLAAVVLAGLVLLLLVRRRGSRRLAPPDQRPEADEGPSVDPLEKEVPSPHEGKLPLEEESLVREGLPQGDGALIGEELSSRETAAWARRLEDDLSRAARLLDSASGRLQATDYQGAVRDATEAAQIFSANGIPHGEGRALAQVGAALVRLNDPERAEGACQQALRLLRSPDDLEVRAWALSNLGLSFAIRGKAPEAAATLQDSLSAFRETGRPFDEAWLLATLGRVNLSLERPHEAVRLLERALALNQEPGNLTRAAEWSHALGNAHAALGEPDRALAVLRKAHSRARQIQAPHLEAEIALHQALILIETGRDGEARKLLEVAEESARRSGSDELLGRVHGLKRSLEPRESRFEPRERASSPPDDSSGKQRYRFSAFYPEKVEPETVGRILAYATLGRVPARDFAQEAVWLMDLPSGVEARVAASEPVAVPTGRTITVTPNVPGLDFGGLTEARMQLWEEVQSVEFRFRPRPDSVGSLCEGSVDFWLEGLILASVRVKILVQEETPEFFRRTLRQAQARPYRSVFPSYSRRDGEVVDRLELYAEAFGDRYLRDIRALRSGEEFDPRLQQFIEQADVFQLFWSRNAAESAWVRKEWQLGWSQRTSRPDPYFVRPVYWTPSPEPEPPDPLCTVTFARITV